MGDIYLGKVINILENINVAFIRLDKRKQNGFMMLKDDSYFNKNIRLGEDIVVQIIKEEISKKVPLSHKNIFEDEKIKVYPYNKNDSIFERKFNFSQRQYLQIVTKLIKPKDSSIEFKEKTIK